MIIKTIEKIEKETEINIEFPYYARHIANDTFYKVIDEKRSTKIFSTKYYSAITINTTQELIQEVMSSENCSEDEFNEFLDSALQKMGIGV